MVPLNFIGKSQGATKASPRRAGVPAMPAPSVFAHQGAVMGQIGQLAVALIKADAVGISVGSILHSARDDHQLQNIRSAAAVGGPVQIH